LRRLWTTRTALEALVVFAVTAGVRWLGIEQEAIHDELHHVLAAKSYLADGSLAIGDGEPYLRGKTLTVMIAWLFSTLGESLVVARLPALVAGSLLSVTLYLWLCALGERAAGWIAAVLVALNPDAIIASQWARFYTLQELSFLLGSIAAFSLMRRRGTARRDLALAGLAGAGLGFAVHLQITSTIGVAGLLLAAILHGVVPLFSGPRPSPQRWQIAGLLAALAALGLLASWKLGMIDWWLRVASYTALWAADSAGAYRYYYGILLENYSVLWPLLPLLGLLAASRQPLLAMQSASIFGVAFLAHSLLAWKAWRYIEYAMPFFYLLVALGAVEGIRRLAAALPDLLTRLLPFSLAPARLRALATVSLVLVLGFAALGNRSFFSSLKLMRVSDPGLSFPGMIHQEGSLSWSATAARIAPLLEEVETVVSSDSLKALYYLGRIDYEFNRDHLFTEQMEPEFHIDSATGFPVVSQPDSLRRIIDCHRSGLVVAERRLWGVPWSMPEDTTRLIAARARSLPLPPEWGMLVYRWDSPVRADAQGCPPAARTTGEADG
jgi:hypothetical protein